MNNILGRIQTSKIKLNDIKKEFNENGNSDKLYTMFEEWDGMTRKTKSIKRKNPSNTSLNYDNNTSNFEEISTDLQILSKFVNNNNIEEYNNYLNELESNKNFEEDLDTIKVYQDIKSYYIEGAGEYLNILDGEGENNLQESMDNFIKNQPRINRVSPLERE